MWHSEDKRIKDRKLAHEGTGLGIDHVFEVSLLQKVKATSLYCEASDRQKPSEIWVRQWHVAGKRRLKLWFWQGVCSDVILCHSGATHTGDLFSTGIMNMMKFPSYSKISNQSPEGLANATYRVTSWVKCIQKSQTSSEFRMKKRSKHNRLLNQKKPILWCTFIPHDQTSGHFCLA